jgi:uncharacterized membrane protein YhhN
LKFAGYLYLLIGAIDVFADLTHTGLVQYITKPLLMPVLIAFYISSSVSPLSKADKLMICAWLFSWMGDVALMLPGDNKNYFLIGLVGFLITHILYANAFLIVRDRAVIPVLKTKPWVLIPLVAYLAGLMSLIFPALDTDMRIPVIIYTSVIGLMIVCALNRYKRVSDSSYALVFGGALLFMFSDSLIAVNKFLCHGTLFMAGTGIMTLYITGQYLIARGMLRNETTH